MYSTVRRKEPWPKRCLALRTTGSFVEILGAENLPVFELFAISKKAECRLDYIQRLTHPRLCDVEDLWSRLQAATALPEEEEDQEESCVLEAQARKDIDH